MSLPAYQLLVLDPNTGAVRILLDGTAFYDLRYSRALNDVGIVAMTLPSTEIIREAFILDAFIEIYRANLAGELQFEETYLTRLMHRYVEGNEERFVVGGLSLNSLLMRRIIDPDDDPLIAGGFSTKSGEAGTVIFDYCEEQIGSIASTGRSIPSLTVLPPAIPGNNTGARLRHENLFKIIQGMSKQGAVDFQIRRTGGNNMELYIGIIGSDKTRTTNEPLGQPWVGLTPRYGNLTLPSLIADRKEEENFIYALGQGQREKRIVYKAAGAGTTESPFNRIEFAEDIRNVEKSDVVALISGAEMALKEKQFKRTFTYQPSNVEPGNTYREDWDVGDALTVTWDEDEFDLRIINAQLYISSSGESLNITVANDFVFPVIPQPSETVVPGSRWTMWHKESIVLSGSALTIGVNGSQVYNGEWHQNPAGAGDIFTNGFFVRAGTYTFSVLGMTGTNFGRLDWSVDGVVVAALQDWYSGVGAFNVVKTATITVATDGWHVLRGAINGKNASSTDYFLLLTKFWLKQVSD